MWKFSKEQKKYKDIFKLRGIESVHTYSALSSMILKAVNNYHIKTVWKSEFMCCYQIHLFIVSFNLF